MNALEACRRCTRLVSHLRELRAQYPEYHNAPVGSWGAGRPRLLIVGLAPGLHGANRTGRAFVGDSSGRTLFEALAATGWSSSADPLAASLSGARITNVAKCLPPENRPSAEEIANCGSWLQAELNRFLPPARRTPRAVLCLGTVAHHTVRRQLGLEPAAFKHGDVDAFARRSWLFTSYHPSRQNVNTGRLTPDMLQDVLTRIRQHLY